MAQYMVKKTLPHDLMGRPTLRPVIRVSGDEGFGSMGMSCLLLPGTRVGNKLVIMY